VEATKTNGGGKASLSKNSLLGFSFFLVKSSLISELLNQVNLLHVRYTTFGTIRSSDQKQPLLQNIMPDIYSLQRDGVFRPLSLQSSGSAFRSLPAFLLTLSLFTLDLAL